VWRGAENFMLSGDYLGSGYDTASMCHCSMRERSINQRSIHDSYSILEIGSVLLNRNQGIQLSVPT